MTNDNESPERTEQLRKQSAQRHEEFMAGMCRIQQVQQDTAERLRKLLAASGLEPIELV